ncbi:sensor histidine kinase [Steroidobacter cummioxidans]|uniref:sensor histidine kinase n=1 Tax=Steroidobacter cummioxidans TaxID=1803913 RepID=UPI0013797D72|nr:ATP-binding protein [Steroidobacter cummioxidans]
MGQPVLLSLLVLLVLAQSAVLAFWAVRDRRFRSAQFAARHLQSADTHAGRLALVGEIAGSIAHEISQPLSAILTNADAAESLLSQPQPPLDEIRRMLADIRRDDLRANDIVRHLHSLLKRRELQTTMLDLNEVAATALTLIQPVARKRLVTVRSRLDPSLPPIHGDAIHLEQVLLNLMMNAMDAMASNTANGTTERILDVTTSRYDKYFAAITVTDTGPGIAAAYRPRIFDSFFSTKQEGMGLGLAIARTIVHAHGGKIWQEGTSAGGAAFKFTIPLQAG